MIVRSFPYAKVPEPFWLNNIMDWLVPNVGPYRDYRSYSSVMGPDPSLSTAIQDWWDICDKWIAKANLKTHRNDICMISELHGDGWRVSQIDELLVTKGADTRRIIVIECDDPDNELLMRLSV